MLSPPLLNWNPECLLDAEDGEFARSEEDMERVRLREKGDDESINELSFRSKSAIDLLVVGKAPWKTEEG